MSSLVHARYDTKDKSIHDPNAASTSGFPSPYIIFDSGIPVGVPSSGSFANNGALSGLTAFATTYSVGIYLYFPANAIFAGSAAGVYFTIMSSTTAGTVYQNAWNGTGIPIIPETPIPWVCTGPGAYTQSTGIEVNLMREVIPANTIGPMDSFKCHIRQSYNNSAGTKVLRGRYAGTRVWGNSNTTTTAVATEFSFKNLAPIRQIAYDSNGGDNGNSGGTILNLSLDSTVDQLFFITAQIATATDFVILLSYTGSIVPASR